MGYNIIMDIDQTLVDSSSAEEYRNSGNWQAALNKINLGHIRPFIGLVETISDAKSHGHEIVFVSSSPRMYAEKILESLGLAAFPLVAYHDTQRHKPYPDPYEKAKEYFSDNYQPLLIIGDSLKDIAAANNLYGYDIFAIWSLWGLTRLSFARQTLNHVQSNNEYPSLIMEKVSELRDFLSYRWSLKHDEYNVAYAFNYYPSNGGYRDFFSMRFLKDIKGSNTYDTCRFPLFICKWAIQFLISYVEKILEDDDMRNRSDLGILVVPSSSEGRWNNALINSIVPVVVRATGIKDCSRLIRRHTARDASHTGNDRSIATNVNTMCIDNPEITAGLEKLIILDDIVTSGNTFEACKRVIERDASKYFTGEIACVALAKTKHFNFEDCVIGTCKADKERFASIQYSDVRMNYWLNNRNGVFENRYHTLKFCVQQGIKWSFTDLDGVKFFAPLDCEECPCCMEQLPF